MGALTLTADQRRALLRMGDLGMRGAAQALAQLLGAAPALAVSSVEVVPLRAVAALLGPGDRVVAGIAFRLYGGTTGRFLVLMPREAAIAVVAALTGHAGRRPPALTEVRGRDVGMVVDEIVGVQDVLVKPLGKALRGLRGFAGVTIMGDGSVVLILDLNAL